jgi:hypothetical protein
VPTDFRLAHRCGFQLEVHPARAESRIEAPTTIMMRVLLAHHHQGHPELVGLCMPGY